MILPLLPTKLHHPPLPGYQVSRPHLLARLNQGLALGHKLMLIAAPAGFGKTTLVSQWIEDLHARRAPASCDAQQDAITPTLINCAWLSLDEYDNDLALFLQYLVAAVQTVFPAIGADTLRLLQAPQLPPVHYLATTLLRELDELTEDFILVLEDYHFVTETSVHQLLTDLLEHLPRQVHLVLMTRTEPPLPLARLRVRQQMTEIRAADLSFSYAETQAFLAQALGKPPTHETVTTLHTRTEGWVAGLQLAALALSGPALPAPFSLSERANETAFVRAFAGSSRHVMEYLSEEVLVRQPQTVQTFLLRTSILDRFCAPLCEAILSEGAEGQAPALHPLPLAPAGGQSILAYLAQANLFVVPLDDQGDWYRYHHLFQDLLRHHLQARVSAVEIATLHRRASAWLADHGRIEEAIQHALAGGDDLAAAHLVEGRRHDLLNREQWRTLERLLALLPEALVQQRAALLVTRAWVLSVQFKLAVIPPLLQAAANHLQDQALVEADAQLLHGEMDALWSQNWCWQNEGQLSLAAAQQALARLPADCLYARGGALIYLGFAAQTMGQSAVAMQTLRAALESHQAYPNTFVARVLYSQTIIHYLAGKLTPMHQTAQDFLEVATQADLALTMAWAHYLLGVVHYEWNELEAAAHHFAAVVDLRYSVHTLAAHMSWLGLAWTYQALGRFDHAWQQAEALLQFHREMNNQTFLPATYSFQARLALQQGDEESALRWAQTAHLDPVHGPLVFLEIPQLTYAKVLLRQATTASLAEATSVLAQLRDVAETTHNSMRLIEILALQALVAADQRQTEQALATLGRAVLLAKPGRFIRTFVDLGPPLAGLLYQLAARGVEAEYLGQVLAAFPPTAGAADPAQHIRRAAQANLIEPLTERESEVLMHLSQGLPNKAIAHALNISALTVKRHATNLYQKLGVKSRKQAVARARALGILPPEHV